MTEQSKTQVSDNGNPSDFQSENAGSIPATCSNALEALDALDELDMTLSAIAADLIFGMEGMSVNWASEMRENEYKAHIATIKQALTQQGWQDVETAPKDGSWILAHYEGGNWYYPQAHGERQTQKGKHNIVVVHYNKNKEGQGNEMVWGSFGASQYMKADIKYWMPLPKPPTQGESE